MELRDSVGVQLPPYGMMIPAEPPSHSFPRLPSTTNDNSPSMIIPSSIPATTGTLQDPNFMAGGFGIEPHKKKRGRPRKYSSSPDGNIALGLTPAPVTPFSGKHGCTGDGGTPLTDPSAKKHRGRPPCSGKKQLDALGGFGGVGFTPHIITVNGGQDIASTIMAFSQQGLRSVCILSANGIISNVTLRQPEMSGAAVTYEGRFEIISLSGSFLPSLDNTSCSGPVGLCVSVATSDGQVLGGVVAGMLVAAAPVQVIVGTFIVERKKRKYVPSPAPQPNMLNFGGPMRGTTPSPEESVSGGSTEESGSGSLNRAEGQHYNYLAQPIPANAIRGWSNSMSMLTN